MRIQNQKYGTLTESERIELARLLIKAGYTVWIGKAKDGSKTVPYIEAREATADGNDTGRNP